MRAAIRRAWSRVKEFFNNGSLLSWVILALLLLLFVKVVLFGGVQLLMSTPYPMVTTISESMERHPADFDAWWEKNKGFYLQHNITKESLGAAPFPEGIDKGDVVIVSGRIGRLEPGMVVVYHARTREPIIHRLITVNEDANGTIVTTKGDNNPAQIITPELDERKVHEEQLIGRAVFRIPYLGYLRALVADMGSRKP